MVDVVDGLTLLLCEIPGIRDDGEKALEARGARCRSLEHAPISDQVERRGPFGDEAPAHGGERRGESLVCP